MKKKFPKIRTEKKLSEKRLCVLLIHLIELLLSPQKPFSKTVLVEFQRDIFKPMEGYGEKGNILRYKLERSFLRHCFVFRVFISQRYSFPLQKPFAKTVLVEFAKGYLEAHRGL